MKKIKSIMTTRFEVALFEHLGYYRIIYTQNGKETKSEKIVGYWTADHMFSLKLIDLEGN